MFQVVTPNLPGPYYAIAHSTGGNILIRALAARSWFRKAAVTAPLVGLLYGNWPLPIVHVLVFLSNWSGFGWLFLPGQRKRPMGRDDFPGNPLTSDQWRWERDSGTLEAAPHLGSGAPTFAWLRAAMKSTAKLKRMNARTALYSPLLLVMAGMDRVVDNEAIRRFASRVPSVSLITIAEAQHEILTETDTVRNQFLAAFDSFVEG